jgi:choline transporter-like protein 2/4/5
MFFWVFEFIQAVFDYVIIVGVCTWYFSSTNDTSGDFSLTTGFKWALGKNSGSLAFGSFILAVIWIIRVIFEYVDSKLKDAKEGNKAV